MTSVELTHPSAWKHTTLGEVCEIQLGKMLSPAAKGGVRPVKYLRNANVQWTRFELADVAQMDFSVREEEKFLLRKGDLLVCEGGEPGRAAVWNGEIERCCYQKALHRLRPRNGGADSHFLMYRLWHGAFRSEFTDSSKKTTIAHLPAVRLERLPLTLPPLAEQRRLAGRLQEQLAAVADARAALQAQLAATAALPAAHLQEVFESQAARKWRRREFGEVCRIDADMVDPQLPQWRNLPHVNGENIESGTGKICRVRSAEEDGVISGKYLFHKGDVLYSKLRPYLRKVALATFSGLCSADMYPLKADPIALEPAFTVWALLSEDFTKYAVNASERSRMPKLNREQLFAWKIPLPPLDRQQALAAELEARFAEIATLRTALEARLAAVDRLPAALLREVFGG